MVNHSNTYSTPNNMFKYQQKACWKRKLRLGLAILLSGCFTVATAQENGSLVNNRTDAVNGDTQKAKPYLIMICGDGFRYDYAAKYDAENLLKLSANGVRADRMIPSYPSVTHPNHFTLLTGLYPGHTGIVGNSFYDPARKAFFKTGDGAWFNAEPVWATAEKQHLLTANYHWVDANATIGGTRINYIFKAQKTEAAFGDQAAAFVSQLLSMPDEKRPHLILMYFGDTDHAGHGSGPDAPETQNAAKNIDMAVGKINEAAQKSGLPVNFIFVSDHGMANIDKEHPIPVPAVIDTAKFVINNQNPLVNIYARDKNDVPALYQQLKNTQPADYDVYLSKDIPAEFHYGGKDDRYNRVGDIVLIARYPKTFNPKPGPGAHGYNPFRIKEMGASFFAWGPAFKSKLPIGEFKNIEVYQVITSILNIKGNPGDGDGSLARQIIK